MHVLPFLALAVTAFTAMPTLAANREWPASGFDKIDLRSAGEVSITSGPGFSVRADGDPRLLERLTADVRNGTLILGWRQGESAHVKNGHIHIAITMPHIAGASISGAGTMTVDRVEAPDFAANVGGAGTIRVTMLRAQRTTLAMGGTGEIVVAGRTGRLDARVSGVGSINAAGLMAANGAVGMAGTGNVRARVDGPVDVTMSGLGSVEILGQPRCTVHKSGLGSVRCD